MEHFMNVEILDYRGMRAIRMFYECLTLVGLFILYGYFRNINLL